MASECVAGPSRQRDSGTSRVSAAGTSRQRDSGTSRVSAASTSRGSDASTSRQRDSGTSMGSAAGTSRERDSGISRGSDASTSRASPTVESGVGAADTSRVSAASTSRRSSEKVGKEFWEFKEQLAVVQTLMDSYNMKIIDKTLCEDDLVVMKYNLEYLSKLEQGINGDKMKSIYVAYKVIALKMVQESYRICNWLIQKQFSEMDNVFELHSFFDKIFEACAGKENPLDHINTLFTDVLKNSNNFNLHIYGNIKQNSIREIVLKPSKKEYQKSQKRPLEDQITPIEVENEIGDNELQITMTRVKNCLKRAVSNNDGKPISFIKFAIDPFSFPHTVENLFHLSLLVKDKIVKIGLNTGLENDKFATITVVRKKNNENDTNQKTNFVSSLFKINRDIWKKFIVQYNIEDRMIPQDD